jgi:hypothetical protein
MRTLQIFALLLLAIVMSGMGMAQENKRPINSLLDWHAEISLCKPIWHTSGLAPTLNEHFAHLPGKLIENFALVGAEPRFVKGDCDIVINYIEKSMLPNGYLNDIGELHVEWVPCTTTGLSGSGHFQNLLGNLVDNYELKQWSPYRTDQKCISVGMVYGEITWLREMERKRRGPAPQTPISFRP